MFGHLSSIHRSVEASEPNENVFDEGFDDYSLTTDIHKAYATKNEMKQIDDKFNNYSLTTDIQKTYLTKDEMKQVDNKFCNHTTVTDFESTYLKKADLPSTDLQFTVDNGFSYFTVKNEHIDANNGFS